MPIASEGKLMLSITGERIILRDHLITDLYDMHEILEYDMDIDLKKLDFEFTSKPLLIGGMAMEYYGLRKAGRDIDFVISKDDHRRLSEKYPDNIKDLYGDRGICEYEFEIWNQICTFDYDHLKEGAIEENDYIVVSLEKLLFLKAIAMNKPKYLKDLELVVDKILRNAYGKD